MTRGKKYTGEDMEALRRGRGGRCELCGSNERLEWAHVKPTGLCGPGRGLQDRVRDIKKNPECYRLLCHECHKRVPGWRHWKQVKMSQRKLKPLPAVVPQAVDGEADAEMVPW
jgi:hypothetical protein